MSTIADIADTKPSRLARAEWGSKHYRPGTLILDKYRLEKMLGEGGMGTVWRARNVFLDAPVALKLLRPDMQGEESSARLLLEARVEAKLRHPNIIRVFDYCHTEHGDAFVVMEVLDGLSLEDLLEDRGALSAIEAVQLLLPVIDALFYAHENGVVHRDLKPGNIFLDRIDRHIRPKLLDFGIAKSNDQHESRSRTRTGALIGSPAYMAPEQARAETDVDHRADIFAICVVLYEAISGRAAFPGEGYAVLRAIVEDTLAPLCEADGLETSVWPIIGRGLAKDRTQRFQSMRELGTALAQWLAAQGVSEDLAGNRLSRTWAVLPLATPEVANAAQRGVAAGASDAAISGTRRRSSVVSRLHLLQGVALAVAMLACAPSRIGRESTLVGARASFAAAQAATGAVIDHGVSTLHRGLAKLLQPLQFVSIASSDSRPRSASHEASAP